MTYECEACGEEFRTLTKKRLHDDCPEGARYGETDAPDEEIPTADMDTDDMVDLAIERLLICDMCGASVDGASSVNNEQNENGVSVAVEFDCPECGAFNENTATFE